MDFHSACCSTARAKWRSASSKAKRRWTASRPRWTSQMITTNKQCRIILDKWIRILEYWWFLLHCQIWGLRHHLSMTTGHDSSCSAVTSEWIDKAVFNNIVRWFPESCKALPTVVILIYIYIYWSYWISTCPNVLLNSELHEFSRNMEIGWHWYIYIYVKLCTVYIYI